VFAQRANPCGSYLIVIYTFAFFGPGLRSVCQYGELHDAQLLGFFVVRGNHVCPQRLQSSCFTVGVILLGILGF
jgi:hypothetical protein